jgi:Family of unknown function (DUF6500)
MSPRLKQKIIEVCDSKMKQNGPQVGLSFYAFFANKNDNPQLLMKAAQWWIMEYQLDHFGKAEKIKTMVSAINDA